MGFTDNVIETDWSLRRALLIVSIVWCIACLAEQVACAQNDDASPAAAPDSPDDAKLSQQSIRELLNAGGKIGWIIIALSVAAVALIVEHLLSIRRGALMPGGLAEETHRCIMANHFEQADQQCKLQPSFLGHVLSAGIAEVGVSYSAIEKAMEDSSTQQSSRLFRKIEYLSVIGTIAPMLGLLGTVWGMIQAFLEFEKKANPQVSELAPGIYKALVTTLLGLSVAVPALAAFAIFRNRIDGLVAEASLLAEHVFADYKRSQAARRKAAKQQKRQPSQPQGSTQNTASGFIDREAGE